MQNPKLPEDWGKVEDPALRAAIGAWAGQWQPMETAPKDGTWILAHGSAFPEFAKQGGWMTADTALPRVPFTWPVKWIEGWYDEEVDLGNGTYKKERKLGYSYWWPEPHAFHPTHWMPLPNPPETPRA